MLTFAAPAFLWTLLALPLVVLLHRIRVRRQRREVAGLFLWRQAKDLGSSRPRFHAGLLLLLQLLAVSGLALALARPQLVLTGPADRVLVIDASASMLALDGPTADEVLGEADAAIDADGLTGRRRLDTARDVAERLVEGSGRVAIVRGGLEPRTVLGFTSDALEVRRALDGLQAGDAGMDAARALVLARDLAGAGAAAGDGGEAVTAEIHWLSDTPPPSLAGVEVHPLAGRGANAGITGFEVVAGQAWVRLSSGGGRPVEVPLELYRGETPVARTDLLVPARGDVSFTLPVGEGGGVLTARIVPPADDALPLDDVAHTGAPRTRVGLEAPFAALERALGAIAEVDAVVAGSAAALPSGLDLYVLSGPLRSDLPDAPTVLLPPREGPAVAAEVLDWVRTDPLLRFVDLRALTVALVDPPPFGEEEGWTTLIRGAPLPAGDGDDAEAPPPGPVPLLQRRDRPPGPVWRFAFHPVRGDLTLRPAFPTLIVNLVDRVRGVPRVRLGEALPEGASADGEPVQFALEPGFYRLADRSVHASLLAETETRLPGPESFGAAADATGAAPPGTAPAAEPAPAAGPREGPTAPRTLVPSLLALVLVLVALEWWGWTGWRGLRRARPRAAARGPR